MKCCESCGTPLVRYKKRGIVVLECPYCGRIPSEYDLEDFGGLKNEDEEM